MMLVWLLPQMGLRSIGMPLSMLSLRKKPGFRLAILLGSGALVPDISISYLSGYYKINKVSAAALSMRYFSLGSIQFTDQFGNNTVQFTPNEFAIDGSYSRKLSRRLSAGLSGRYVNSNLTGGQPSWRRRHGPWANWSSGPGCLL